MPREGKAVQGEARQGVYCNSWRREEEMLLKSFRRVGTSRNEETVAGVVPVPLPFFPRSCCYCTDSKVRRSLPCSALPSPALCIHICRALSPESDRDALHIPLVSSSRCARAASLDISRVPRPWCVAGSTPWPPSVIA